MSSSSTPSVSTARPSFTPRPSGEIGGGGGGGNNNGFASPAASNLYLYTFLATLVLLLLVSGAVVARSISLRVRARRAIEESIRNGTYVPPPRELNGANAPKPGFYDTHLKEADSDWTVDEKHGRWNQLVPVAAAFVPSKESPRLLPQPATSADPPPRPPLSSRIRNLNPFRVVQIQDILDELASRDLHSRMTAQPQPSQTQLATAAFRTAPVEEGNSGQQQQELAPPSAMRVAVLIAMPDPSRPVNNSTVQDDSSSSTSSSKGKSPSGRENATKSEDEVEVPYVEFGIAEVPFMPPGKQSRSASSSSSSPSLPSGSN